VFFKNQLTKNKKKEMLRTTLVAILPFVMFSVILATATMTTVAPILHQHSNKMLLQEENLLMVIIYRKDILLPLDMFLMTQV
jgi:hypothetical protein